MKMQIQQLEKDYPFKFQESQKKWRTLKRLHQLPDHEGIPEEHRGKLLVIFDGCRQAILDPTDEVIVDESYLDIPQEMNEYDADSIDEDLPF